MTTSLVIVDTGCANLNSVRYAFARIGVTAQISTNAATIQAASHVVLPGVGTAAAARRQLEQHDLLNVLANLQQPVLGICLGMQLLGTHSVEGEVLGLGVVPILTEALNTQQFPVPHMGWNRVTPLQDSPLLRQLPSLPWFYFVHSYAMPVTSWTTAQCTYGEQFSAMVQHNNYFGVQFHPERSGSTGLQLLRNFVELTDANPRS